TRFRERFKAELELRQLDPQHFEFTIREATESSIRERAVAQAKDIILRRVDALGLREASVSTRDEDVIVEVPGDKEAIFAEIREIISQTARLEFKLLDDESDYFADLERTSAPESLPEGLQFRRETVPVGLDASGEAATRVGTFAYVPFLPGEKSAAALARLKSWIATLTPPPDREIGYELEYRVVDQATLKEEEAGYRTYLLRSRTEITGDMVRDAAAQPSQATQSLGGWHVSISFTDQGGKMFERTTGANVKRRFAIILDGKVESAPQILDRIAGGNAQITMGSGDPQIQLRDSKKLELVLRSGALPAPISPSNEQLIGPSLGEEAIRLAVQGAAGGAAIVLLFMFLYYRIGGLIADVSVLMNLFLQLGVLASFGASMTLPGIAGLALTLGMGVDANILINERIREELREGKSPRTAIEIGYNKATSAIVDGQLTTFIAGVVLAQYGTGPIKGFAVNLMVGVVISIFTGVVVSRVLFDLWLLIAGKNASKGLV
ncbi:MAG TPA: protein translocase subunit SecD, partial [Polyangiaceae bacterium]|nr:protein translocase subunit SecD [Polyangiaceae bacterium]